jgi:carbon monoxide dehydrogenase subunit G
MKSFESKITIKHPVNQVYSFLADLNNHRQLMPDNIEDWVSSYDEASFGIKNMAKLSLKVASRVENREIRIIPSAKPPFDLELTWTLTGDNTQTDALFVIKADLNMMMKMLASGPLQKLADEETRNLAALLG